jgi:hypothetical protein
MRPITEPSNFEAYEEAERLLMYGTPAQTTLDKAIAADAATDNVYYPERAKEIRAWRGEERLRQASLGGWQCLKHVKPEVTNV